MTFEKFYSNLAPVYDLGLRLNNYYRAAAFFVSKLPFSSEKTLKVLDTGCGTGLYTKTILKMFPHAIVTAFDMNARMLEQLDNWAQKNNISERVRVFQADIHSVSFDTDTKFYLIITGGVIEYLPNPEISIQNLMYYLKENGIFFNSAVRDNVWGRLVSFFMKKFNIYSVSENVSFFSKNNLSVTQIIKFPLLSYFPISLVKIGLLGKKK